MNVIKGKKWLALLLVWALVITMLPVVPGSVEAKAENATVLYIKDKQGAVTKTVTEDMTVSENGWSWDADTATLTLNGFDGEYIETNGDINILLVSENSITLSADPDGSSVYGIKSLEGAVNIVGDGVGEEDTLSIIQTGFTKKDVYVTGIYSKNDIVITDCKVAISFAAADTANETGYYSRTGLYPSGGAAYVTGSGSLDIDLTETDHGAKGVIRALYAQTTGTIDINIYDADPGDGSVAEYVVGIDGLHASGTGTINLQVPNGEALNGVLGVEESAGDISFAGTIMLSTVQTTYLQFKSGLSIAPNKKITVAGEPEAKCGIIYKQFTARDYGCYLLKEDGSKVTGGTITTQADTPLVFADNPVLDLSGLKVGESYSGSYFHGLAFGGSGGYTFSIDEETPLPSGLYLTVTDTSSIRTAFISGTPKEECPAGSFKIIVTDSESNTASITVSYDAIVNPPKKISVDGTEFTTTENRSGIKWSYVGSTKTLALNGYDGGLISSEEELNIVLTGHNTVTVPAAPSGSSVCGIKSSGGVNIIGDGVGEEDTLSITQTGFTKKDVYATGIYSKNDIVITDCKVAISFAAADTANETGYYSRTGLNPSGGAAYVTGSGSLDIDLTETNYDVKGVVRALYAQTTGTIDINIYDADPGDGSIAESVVGIDGLYASGTGTINLQVPNGEALNGVLGVEESAGDISFAGTIMLSTVQTTYLQFKSGLSIAPNKKITVAGEPEAKCGIIYKQFTARDYGCYLLKEDGSKVTGGTITTQADNPLVFADNPVLDLSGLKVEESYSGSYFHGLAFGGSGGYTFSIDEETPLPSGLYLTVTDTASIRTAFISGTPKEECPAGSFKIIVSDSASNTASITVNYDAITVKNPITAISFEEDEVFLGVAENTTLTPVITPDNASNQNVDWSSSDSSVAYVLSSGKVVAEKPGKTNITATTKQGGFKAVCRVYVKENTPSATAGDTHIEQLVANAMYSVSGNSMTADVYGKIEIEDAWRDKTIEIIKTNAEPKCNSEAQFLYIPEKEAVNIAGFSALMTLEYKETPYDGTAKEPGVSVEGLVKDTDYTVAYENNIDAGSAKAIITGIGDYYGTFSKTFTITPIKMTGITANAYSDVYDKMGHTFTLSGVPAGAIVTYSETEDGYYSAVKPTRVEVGETMVYYKVSLKNYEDFYGSTKITVLPISMEGKTVNLSQYSFTYDGKAKTPAVTITDLVVGTDYMVAYENNINAGKAKAVVTGKGNYGGTIEKEFTITPASIAGKTVTLSQVSYTYDGTEKTPTVSVAGLKQNVDYTVAYANNVNVGTATVIVTGKGNYTGGITKTFEIKEKPAPAKNTTLTDTKTGIKYKVTKAGKSGGTVEFKSPKSKKVTKVTIPATVEIEGITYKVTTIAKSAFSGCSKLKTITIGKNVTTIGDKAFYNCKALTKITIPSQVKKIGKSAFCGCKKLKNITIKTTKLKSSTVGKNAFKGTPKNAKVKVPKKSLKAYKKFLYKKGLHKKAKITK